MNSNTEFQVGKHGIGCISQAFKNSFQNVEFESRQMPAYKMLMKSMNDREIETTLNVGMCELGDIVAFLDNAPVEHKGDCFNLFYTPSCVVYVFWFPGDRYWCVCAGHRGDGAWSAVGRVFFRNSDAKPYCPSDTLTLVRQLEEAKRQDCAIVLGGDQRTPSYLLGELRGYNQGIDEAIKIIKSQE